MAHGPTYRVKFRRRREGRTDYKQRLALLKSGKVRAVVRLQNRTTIVQFIQYDPEGDRVLAQATSTELETLGWDGHSGNLPAAYLTGVLAGTRASEAGVGAAVLDVGQHRPQPGTSVFAALSGMLQAGLEIPHSPDVLPDEDRALGRHISDEVAEKTEATMAQITEGS